MDIQDYFQAKLTPSSASATATDSNLTFSNNSKMDNDNSHLELKVPSARKLKTEWAKDWECESLSGAHSIDTGFESEEEGGSESSHGHDITCPFTSLTLHPDDHRQPPFGDYFREGPKGCSGTISDFLPPPKDSPPSAAALGEKEKGLGESDLGGSPISSVDDQFPDDDDDVSVTYESISTKTSRTLTRPSLTETKTSEATQRQNKRKIAPSNNADTDADSDPKTDDLDHGKVDKLKRRCMRFGDSVVVRVEGNDARNASLEDIIEERKIAYTKTTLYNGPRLYNAGKRGKNFPPTFSPSPVPVKSRSLAPNDLRHKLLGSNKDEGQLKTTHKLSQFRPVIIDGSNVAYEYADSIRRKKHVFDSWGIQVCVDHFVNLGCTEVYVIVPEEKLHDQAVQEGHILHDLNVQGRLLTSWSRQLTSGRWVSSYDDRMILDLAAKKNGIVISNDQFRDLWMENQDWHAIIESRVVGFRFYPGIPNEIRFPSDPFGRHGPSLEFLLKM